jgi:hypothetical protein
MVITSRLDPHYQPFMHDSDIQIQIDRLEEEEIEKARRESIRQGKQAEWADNNQDAGSEGQTKMADKIKSLERELANRDQEVAQRDLVIATLHHSREASRASSRASSRPPSASSRQHREMAQGLEEALRTGRERRLRDASFAPPDVTVVPVTTSTDHRQHRQPLPAHRTRETPLEGNSNPP